MTANLLRLQAPSIKPINAGPHPGLQGEQNPQRTQTPEGLA
jgi:hypothetical protein